jgi:hypothetical protein
LDQIEIEEIQHLVKKYQCQKDMDLILNNLCNSGRLNKAAANRKGFNDKNIQAAMTRLKIALDPYKE